MALIKLLLFDDDDEYSFYLCNYLTHNFSETFSVIYFSKAYSIKEWIEKSDPDIILTSEKYYSQMSGNTKTISVILTAGRNNIELSNVVSIYKYKDVNQIAADIIDIFKKSGQTIRNAKEKTTKLIAIYSAAGNVGKTSVALGISSMSSYSGLSVFYLNLEQFQSSHMFLKSNGEYSLSDIIYYAKDKDEALYSKIPSICSKDIASNIHYFKPPNNVFEINEITKYDVSFIIEAIKACGQYDLIITDMDSQLSENTIKLFEMAEEIIYVFVDEEICLHKSKLFLDNIFMLSNSIDKSTSIVQKLLFVENKVSKQALQSNKSFLEHKVLSRIPFYNVDSSLANPVYIPGGPEIIDFAYKTIAKRYI